MRIIKPTNPIFLVTLLTMATALYACTSSSATNTDAAPPPQALPVVTLVEQPATVYQEYAASLEGSKDIEIRPQVEGYIERIFVDEGARVVKGQPLFKVNDRLYREALNNAKANLLAAQANLSNAEINVSRIKPLVQNNIVSPVQLKSAEAAYNAAAAQVAQARSQVAQASINLGYTLIKAPATGYIGRIPLKTGSLVGLGTPEPLTVLSELANVYAYFSLSEKEFLQFKQHYAGNSIEEKIRQLDAVDLVLPDGTPYPQKGKVELVTGQFNNATGSISFRASFPNASGQLRSGNTGTIRLPLNLPASVIVPQEATYELQDKIFVFVVGDSNKVRSMPIQPAGRSGNYYFINGGLKQGNSIVYAGLDRLRDGLVIQPQAMTMDSLLKAHPL